MEAQETGLFLFELRVNNENTGGRREETRMTESWKVATLKGWVA